MQIVLVQGLIQGGGGTPWDPPPPPPENSQYSNFYLCMWSQKPPEAVSEVENFKILLGNIPQIPLHWVHSCTL